MAMPAGPEQAVHWLSEHEDDPEAASEHAPPQPASIRMQGVGVAGILRREEQLAARNDE